jgi:hypothetical protein
MRAILTVLRRHNAIVVFLSAIFIARLFLADWNSYWSDELLSVAVYGVWNDDLVAMVSHLADNSIHPPLYQAARRRPHPGSATRGSALCQGSNA